MSIEDRFLSAEESTAAEAGSNVQDQTIKQAARHAKMAMDAMDAAPATAIDYMVLQRFAAQHRLPYNALCAAVRESTGATPDNSRNRPQVGTTMAGPNPGDATEAKPQAIVITPTVGRRVWYWPKVHDGMTLMGNQPCDAGVCYVHDDRKVNVAVTDHAGYVRARLDVTLVQAGEHVPTDGRAYCTWMPYQLGQAKKN